MCETPANPQGFVCPSGKQALAISCLLLLCVVPPLGCHRAASEEELGEIHYTLPKVSGAEKALQLPPQLTSKSTNDFKRRADGQKTQKEDPSATPTKAVPPTTATSATEAFAEDSEQQTGEADSAPQEKPPLPENE